MDRPLNPALRGRSVAVVGLGYVGLPLALAFGRVLPTLGFDISPGRVAECARGRDAGTHMKPGATVIFESTVYRGATGGDCVPLLEPKLAPGGVFVDLQAAFDRAALAAAGWRVWRL